MQKKTGGASRFDRIIMKTRCLSLLSALCLAVCTLMTSCGTASKDPKKFTANSFDYFDTVTVITGYAPDQKTFDAVTDEVFDSLAEYHRLYTIYHRFNGMENLCTVNETVDGVHRTVTVDERIMDLLTFAKEMHNTTNGYVNIAMGSVLSLWHDYRTIGTDDPGTASLPPIEKLQSAAAHTAIDDIVLDKVNRTVTLQDAQMTLDVGAVAKGYAVECIAKALEAKGIDGYVLNVGGNVRTIGSKPNGEAWTIGLENPDEGDPDYLAYLELHGEALVTSGSYQRYYMVDGNPYHHIIHPDTLMPATGFSSVSVISDDSGIADALSTALFCMSLDEGLTLVESMSNVEALWVGEDGKETSSSGFQAYRKPN